LFLAVKESIGHILGRIREHSFHDEVKNFSWDSSEFWHINKGCYITKNVIYLEETRWLILSQGASARSPYLYACLKSQLLQQAVEPSSIEQLILALVFEGWEELNVLIN
jgi:hypothetical protein